MVRNGEIRRVEAICSASGLGYRRLVTSVLVPSAAIKRIVPQGSNCIGIASQMTELMDFSKCDQMTKRSQSS
jgi:hypothetical protein